MAETFQSALVAMILEGFPNHELAAFNNAIQTFGVIQPMNMSYQRALEYKLINERGNATFDLEVVRNGAAYEVNRRVANGTFK